LGACAASLSTAAGRPDDSDARRERIFV